MWSCSSFENAVALKFKLGVPLSGVQLPESSSVYTRRVQPGKDTWKKISAKGKKLSSSSLITNPENILTRNDLSTAVVETSIQKFCIIVSESKDASNLFSSLRQWESVVTKQHIVEAMRKELQWVRVLALHDWMIDRANLLPSVFTYNLLIRSVCRMHQWHMLEGLVEEMKMRSCPPDKYTYSMIITALGKEGQFDQAMLWLDNMKASGCHLDLVSYSTIIEMLAQAKDYHRAASVFSQMRQDGIVPDLPLCNVMINVYGKAGTPSDAACLVSTMKDFAIEPSAITYSTLINALAKAKQYSEAIQVFEGMLDGGLEIPIMTCNMMIDVYGKVGMPKAAEKIFWNLSKWDLVPNIVTFNTLIQAYGENEMRPEALAVFHRMKNDGHAPNLRTYNNVLSVYAIALEADKANKLLEEMKEAGVAPNTFTFSILVSMYGKLGWTKKADKLFQTIKNDPGFKIDPVLYNTIISVYEKAGLVGLSKRTLGELRANQKIPVSTLIEVLCKAGKVEEVQKTFWKAQQSGQLKSARVYSSAIIAFSKAQLSKQVIDAGTCMVNAGFLPVSKVLCDILHAYIRESRLEEGADFYRHLHLKGCPMDDDVNCTAIKVLCKNGSVQDAMEILELEKARGGIPSKSMYVALIRGFQSGSHLEKATILFNEMKSHPGY